MGSEIRRREMRVGHKKDPCGKEGAEGHGEREQSTIGYVAH